MISTPAPCVNAISTGEFTRLSSQPKRIRPSAICNPPESRQSQIASSTQRALPGSASPVSEALTSRQVSAVAPTDKRIDAPNSAATSAGSSEA